MKGFSNTATYAAMGAIFALMAVSLAYAAPAAAASPTDQLSDIYAGEAAATNASCRASCIQYFRQGGKLRLIVLDQNGKIFTIRTLHLPAGAKLVSRSGEASDGSGLRPNSTGCTSCFTSSSSVIASYTAHRGGNTYLTTVTATSVYYTDANGTTSLYSVSITTFTIEIDTEPK